METEIQQGQQVIEIMLENYDCKGDLCLLSRSYKFKKHFLRAPTPMFEKSEYVVYGDERLRTPLEYVLVLAAVSNQHTLVGFSL